MAVEGNLFFLHQVILSFVSDGIKNLTVNVQFSHIATSVNILGHLQMGKPTISVTIDR
jgi:hypothetical protein